MKSAFEGLRAPRIPARGDVGKEIREAAQRVERSVSDAKAAVTEKLDDGMVAARRLWKQSRNTVHDGLEEAAHTIKRHPFRSLAIGFAAGAMLGFLAPRPKKR